LGNYGTITAHSDIYSFAVVGGGTKHSSNDLDPERIEIAGGASITDGFGHVFHRIVEKPERAQHYKYIDDGSANLDLYQKMLRCTVDSYSH